MNPLKISISSHLKLGLKTKITLWCLFFTLNFFLWYNRFFSFWTSFLLSLFLACEIGGMFFIGYSKLSRKQKFPRFEFWSWVLLFSTVRFFVVYFILQHKMPVDTVFRHPERAIYFIIGTSAALIFWGYSYSIYEWGLAAREKFLIEKSDMELEIKHPISIRSGGKNIHLITEDILCLEAKGEYVNYLCKHGNYLCFQRMKKAEADLKTYGFIRIHRSYIVNPIHIIANSSSKVQLTNGLELAVSKGYKERLKIHLDSSSRLKSIS